MGVEPREFVVSEGGCLEELQRLVEPGGGVAPACGSAQHLPRQRLPVGLLQY